MSSFSAWLNTVEGNKEKQEKNTINEARRKGTVDELLRADKAKKMKLVSNLIDKAAVPLKAMKDYSDVSQTLAGMVAVVVHRSKVDDEKKKNLPQFNEYTQVELDDALLGMDTDELKEVSAVLLGNARNVITWHHRAAAAFLYLHPAIYGAGDVNYRIEKCAKAVGVSSVTFRSWTSLQNDGHH